MRRRRPLTAGILFPLLAGCAHAVGGVAGTGGTGGSGGATASTSTSTSATVTGATTVTSGTGTGSPPTSCAGANGTKGCCVGTVLWYCNSGGTMKSQDCAPVGNVCGWNAPKSYYGCVAAPAGADPSGKVPIQCM